ncbi:MAG TPA: transporter [Sulfurimonas sp. UBA12504]|nr:MAG: transporter [Sulfurimonas sp. GWF2_37_8]DAB29984.1 MAG TPA: transporter [Sulfurimonas sp. UBA12504]
MKKTLFLLLPAFIYGETLHSLLAYVGENNKLMQAQTLDKNSKQKELDAQQSSYYPTLDLGASYQSSHERSAMIPGDIYSAYANLGFDIYDGGKRSSLVEQKRSEYAASSYDEGALKKSLSLQIVQDFFTMKSLDSSQRAREEASISLQTQLERMRAFYDAKLATTDEVERLKASYETNLYNIEAIKLDILTKKRALELKLSKPIKILEKSHFKEVPLETLEKLDDISALEASRDAIKSFAASLESIYYPQIRLEDTYSYYGYNNTDLTHPEGIYNQNKILLSANFRLYDGGVLKESAEALELNARAIDKRIEYKNDEQKMHHELSRERINTNKIKIQSAKSALVAAQSAFETIEKKYQAGILDNVAYLDALAARMDARALYESSLNDLEIAYAFYYYYSGKNIEEFLQ